MAGGVIIIHHQALPILFKLVQTFDILYKSIVNTGKVLTNIVFSAGRTSGYEELFITMQVGNKRFLR